MRTAQLLLLGLVALGGCASHGTINLNPGEAGDGLTQTFIPSFVEETDRLCGDPIPPHRVLSHASIDWDNDGDLDLSTTHIVKNGGEKYRVIRLCRNEGNLRFTDITSESGLGNETVAQLSWADFDGDGVLDVVVCNSGDYFTGNGDGTFTPQQRGLNIHAVTWSGHSQEFMACAAGDVDGDGDLDIFIGNGEVPNQDDTSLSTPLPNLLLQNLGGMFDETPLWDEALDENRTPRRTNAVVMADFDQDGMIEIFVGNHRGQITGSNADEKAVENELWKLINGQLVEIGYARHVSGGKSTTFGAAVGDLNGDGWLDLFEGNASSGLKGSSDTSRLLFGTSEGFTPNTPTSIKAQATFGSVTVGDLNLDGTQDLIHTAFVAPDLAEEGRLYLNNGRSTFTHVTGRTGVELPQTMGLVLADLDQDGLLEVLSGGRLWYNNTHTPGTFVGVKLRSESDNTMAVGAMVKITINETIFVRHVSAGSASHQQDPMDLHFGLGTLVEPGTEVEAEITLGEETFTHTVTAGEWNSLTL